MNSGRDIDGDREVDTPIRWTMGRLWTPLRKRFELCPRWAQIIIAGVILILVALFATEKSREWIVERASIALRSSEKRWNSSAIKVALLYPDPTDPVGSAADDGRVHQEGFNDGIEQYRMRDSRAPIPIHATYRFQDANDKRALETRLLEKMRELYERDNVRVFVVTMSGAVERISAPFKAWRAECQRNGRDAPVLVSTVASAPGLADRANGVYRYYIRSRDESALLAELAWARGARRATILYITRHAGKDDDAYGRGARDEFISRFDTHGGYAISRPILADATNATAVVREVVNPGAESPPDAVFVVGYGEMLHETMNALVQEEYRGVVYCTSTLTVPQWQPESEDMDERIMTVVPVWRSAVRPPIADRNVVRLFPRLVILRVLEAQSMANTTREFERVFWSNVVDQSIFSINLTVEGDSLVDLQADSKWR